jgi:hypothetical protein
MRIYGAATALIAMSALSPIVPAMGTMTTQPAWAPVRVLSA